jgi:ANTAR domain-containing protein/PAS domain-containing protein
MTEAIEGPSIEAAQALITGAPQRVGRFAFYFEDQRWEWSEQVAQIHGYGPAPMTPTTEVVLSHKHPDDVGQVAATIDDVLSTHKAFSTRHRIIDTFGSVHHVVVVGDRLYDNDGEVIGTYGFYVDVSPLSEQLQQDAVTAKVAEFAENRAGIEQAKGMLMLVYDIDEDAAFNLLKSLSQETNTKLRPLAEQIATDFRAAAPQALTSVAGFDHLLLTAHLRLAPAGDQPSPTPSA